MQNLLSPRRAPADDLFGESASRHESASDSGKSKVDTPSSPSPPPPSPPPPPPRCFPSVPALFPPSLPPSLLHKDPLSFIPLRSPWPRLIQLTCRALWTRPRSRGCCWGICASLSRARRRGVGLVLL
eukprot:739939-Hanusia_phi.AAC.3